MSAEKEIVTTMDEETKARLEQTEAGLQKADAVSEQIEPEWPVTPTKEDPRAESRDVELYHNEFEAKKPLQLLSIAHPPPTHGLSVTLLSERIKDRINTYCKSIEYNNKLQVALVFTNDTSRVGYAKYHHTFPSDLLVVPCQYLVTKDRFREGYPAYEAKEGRRDIATALLIPESPNVKVKYAHFSLRSPQVGSFVQNLMPEGDCKSTLILFGDIPKTKSNRTHECMTEVLRQIHGRFGKNPYSIWGGETPIIYAGRDARTMVDKDVIFGLNIYGSGVNSYSLLMAPAGLPLINFHLKINNFKKRITLQKHSIGFVSLALPIDSTHRQFISNTLRWAFPNTEFTYTLRLHETNDSTQTYVIGKDSLSTDTRPKVAPRCDMSLMIITFDSDHPHKDDSKKVNMNEVIRTEGKRSNSNRRKRK